jgi:hypothetical protein
MKIDETGMRTHKRRVTVRENNKCIYVVMFLATDAIVLNDKIIPFQL